MTNVNAATKARKIISKTTLKEIEHTAPYIKTLHSGGFFNKIFDGHVFHFYLLDFCLCILSRFANCAAVISLKTKRA